MIILALDPGGTTGAVRIEWDGESIPPDPDSLIDSAQIPFRDMPWWLDEQMRDPPDLIVVERFVISPRTVQYTRQPEALYVIGAVLFAAALGDVPIRMQSASDAKLAYPKDRLHGWAVKGKHARDALRHALLACHTDVVV